MNYEEAYAGPFREFLSTSVNREVTPPASRSFPQYHANPQEAAGKLLKLDPNAVFGAMDRLLAARMPLIGRYEWPRMQLLHAIFAAEPARANDYWLRMKARESGVTERSPVFEQLPFEYGGNGNTNALREMLIRSAKNDWALVLLSASILRHERTEWAAAFIRRLLAKPECPGDIARAIILAGLLDASDAATQLWENELREPPLAGWIGAVYEEATQRVATAKRSAEWTSLVLSHCTDDEFFCRWRLLRSSLDRRSLPSILRRLSNQFRSLSPRRKDFVRANWPRITKRADEEKSTLERTLYSFPVGFRWALPWGQR
jgi:hypothetical protein